MQAPNFLQPSLFDALPPLQPIVRPPTTKDRRRQTNDERFADFHAANPGVYVAIVGLAISAKRAGKGKWGTKAIFEILRWQYAMQTQGAEYKLDNTFTQYYARLIMANVKELEGFFETRNHDGEGER